MADGNGKLKMAAACLLVVLALALGYHFLTSPQGPPGPGNGTNSSISANSTPQQGSLGLGKEVNIQTFSAILANSADVFIVMDVRGVNDPAVRHSILQCGVDFAGSPGLGGKALTVYSLDGQNCMGASQQGNRSVLTNYTSSYCFGQMANGMAIYLHEGNETRFYTNAMAVGLGENYTAGGCSIGFANRIINQNQSTNQTANQSN